MVILGRTYARMQRSVMGIRAHKYYHPVHCLVKGRSAMALDAIYAKKYLAHNHFLVVTLYDFVEFFIGH